MGSQNSRGKNYYLVEKYGQVTVQTTKPIYFAGETVSGKVLINLDKPFPGSQLVFKFKGKEVVHLVVPRDHKDDYTKNQVFTQKKDIIKHISPAYTWESLLPGQYEIPFAFMLSPYLPPSFHQQGKGYQAYVTYQVEAFLQPHDPQGTKLKHKHTVILREPIKNPVKSHTNEAKVSLASCNGCISRGTNILKVDFEKNCYAPGEKAQVTVHFDNSHSELHNKNLKFSLKQVLKLKVGDKTHDMKFTKVEKEIPGILAGKSSQSTTIAIVIPPLKADIYSIDNNNFKKKYLLSLKEDHSVSSSSAKSSLITSEYYLKVSCPMKGCFSANKPKVKCPIQLYMPEIQFPVISPPANWAPQAVPNVYMAFAPSHPHMEQSQLAIQHNVLMSNNSPLEEQMPVPVPRFLEESNQNSEIREHGEDVMVMQD